VTVQLFGVRQEVMRLDGTPVVVVEVLPVGLTVFYRVEYPDGDTTLLQSQYLRSRVGP
jgi:hypothetical protein